MFDSPLFIFKLFKYKDGTGGFLINIHHIIGDAWSSALGVSEVIDIYTNLKRNEKVAISEPSYIDYISSEQEYLNSKKFETDKIFWDELFKEIPEQATIPSASTSTKLSSKAKRKHFILDKELADSINTFCTEQKVSIFNVFMGILSIYLGRVSNLDEFVIGTPILNRSNVKEKRTTGMYISTVPFKVSINNETNFIDFISKISADFFQIFRHQKYPYQYLLEDLRKTDSKIPNLYNIMLSYQNTRSNRKTASIPYDFQWIFSNHIADDIDIHIHDLNDSGDLNISYDYLISKYTDEDISNLHTRLLSIIKQVINNADIKLKDIETVTPEEKQKILYEFNDTKMDYPKDKTIAELFEEQVEKAQSNIAVVFEGQKLTYKELNEKANQLAHYLLQQNVHSGDIVPVLMNRSSELIITMLAIIKIGAVYLPVSTEYPNDRIVYILQNSAAKILLTKSEYNKVIYENISTLLLDNFNYSKYSVKNLECTAKPNDTLYIIYTSGSTGNPKGVKICHKNLVNFVSAFTSYFDGISGKDRCLASTNITFDVSIWEFFVTLLNGAALYLYEENTISDIFKYCNSICKNHITLLYIPPNILENVYSILSTHEDVRINKILIGVEPIGSATMNKYYSLNPDMHIVNAYGPTETTICATAIPLQPSNIKKYRVIPIGKPLSNLNLFILDKSMQLCPIDVPGELYITGDGVGNGYLNNKELTSKSFFKLPNHLNSLLAYKTGDLVKWNEDGTISFIGRKDNQVKVNGHRIELGEIESCIYQYPNIEKVVVMLDNNKKIIAYFSAEMPININDLRAFMQRKLAVYFIPNFFVQVDNFKLTANGKVDRKALSEIKIATTISYEAPHTKYEKQLVEIFENILGVPKIGINDNFFELGGDSLVAIKLQIECFNKGLELSYKDIFTYPTIKLLSQNIAKTSEPVLEQEYDYTAINDLIAKNSTADKIKLHKNKLQNILLTGSTGYLGSHVLDKLLKHTKANIYCLVRSKNNNDPQTRLLDVLRFYFGNKYDKQVFKRIFVIEGDISDENLGLDNIYYEEIGKAMSCVINSAAIVKHYGDSNMFNKTNITGTQNIINFCNKFNCRLIHLSTLSVAGGVFEIDSSNAENKAITFNEKSLFINQDLSNVYIHTKFLAERLVLENVLNNNLDATIIRLGNITNRYSDGTFQINVSENAFINRLNSFIQIGCIPESLRNQYVEFSPVDLCANAIVKIATYNKNYTIFHIYNNRYITLEKLVKIFNRYNVKLDIVSASTFNKKVKELSDNKDTKQFISGIVNDFKKNKELNYSSNIINRNTFTNAFLKKTSFKWPKIDEKYINKYIIYLKSIGYIK